MRTLEGLALWTAVAAYVVSIALLLAGWAFKRLRPERIGRGIAAVGLAAHTVTIIARWIETGHGPVQGTYENSVAGAWFLAVIAAVVIVRYRLATPALLMSIAVTLLLLGNGIMHPNEHAPLEPPFRSNWLVVHVLFAWLAFGSYLVASVLAAYYLAAKRHTGDANTRLPVIDELTAQLITYGFLSHAVMLTSGAIWAHGLWGRYWAWDPIETWSLVSWLFYGVYLHLRFTLGWRGNRAALLALGAAFGIVITFFGIGVISDVHTELL